MYTVLATALGAFALFSQLELGANVPKVRLQ